MNGRRRCAGGAPSHVKREPRNGAHPALAQKWLRHSSIDLTMNVYTKLGKSDQDAALEFLPHLSVEAAGA